MNVSRAHIDPRIRERRVAVQRALGRRRLRILVACTTIVGTLCLAFVIVESPLLDVDHVRVDGMHALRAADVRAAAHVHMHRPLLFTDTGAIARRVEALSWVAHASVRREFPGTIHITVDEYTPTAFVRAGNDVVLVAPNGRAIALVPTAPAGMWPSRPVSCSRRRRRPTSSPNSRARSRNKCARST
jgi:cell division protein FtsQ